MTRTAPSGCERALTDPAVDSLVGKNGATGLSVAFAAGTFNVNNTWRSVANLQVESQIWCRDAGAYWYNQSHLGLQTKAIPERDSRAGYVHLYHAPHIYRRRRRTTRPGVIRLISNVQGFTGDQS
jgi:hypothetical protein